MRLRELRYAQLPDRSRKRLLLMSSESYQSPPEFMLWEPVSIFVGTGTTRSLVAYPESADDCSAVLQYCRENGLSICPRGSARSYGDVILNDQNVLLDLSRMNRILEFDEEIAQVTVEAGTKIVDIFAKCHHLGFTVPASPTDSTISVGGALAANVNGKDSWRVGNFGDQVVRMKVMLASGETRALDREHERELFLAIIGGMGLLGVVLEVTLQLQKIPSPYLDVSISSAADLDGLLRQLDKLKNSADFVVVWIDGYASGKNLGRSVIHATTWAKINIGAAESKRDIEKGIETLAGQKRNALAFYRATRHLINLAFHVQKILFRPFNKFYFWLHNRGEKGSKKPDLFLGHNFDKSYVVPPPDILCGPHGYTVQITIPYGKGKEGLAEMLELCRDIPCPPATTILRLHRKDEHLISFSEDGYSLNVEFHPKKRHRAKMQEFMQRFIECGIRYGSKVHLPKDITLTREQFRCLYPNYRKFLEIKQQVDPEKLFQSGMYRRLFAEQH